MINQINDEADFAFELAYSLSPDLSEQEKRIIDIRYGLDYGGIVNFGNGYLRKLIKAIHKGRVSVDVMDLFSKIAFTKLILCGRLDEDLRKELQRLLFGV